MKPKFFKEATIELKKPQSMTDEQCGSLHVYQSPDGTCVSLWTATFWERLKFLFHGKIWLGVHSGKTQPPVWLDCTETVFIEEDKQVAPEFPNDRRQNEKQQCYKGHGECDCPGLCRESC